MSNDDAKSQKAGGISMGASTSIIIGRDTILTQLSEAEPGNIQKIAASQIRLLDSYYNAVLSQATKSFNFALIAAVIGLAFFVGAIGFLLNTQTSNVAIISVIGGVIVEVISGINFVLYGKTTNQLAYFHQRLDQTQRFLLANSICESLPGVAKQKTRSKLVAVIATYGMVENTLPSTDK